MNYEVQSVYENAGNKNTSRDIEYHQYLNHSNHRDDSSRTYSNEFYSSSIPNGHHRLDDIDSEQLERGEQQIDDYEEIAPDRPRLLMWGLTK